MSASAVASRPCACAPSSPAADGCRCCYCCRCCHCYCYCCCCRRRCLALRSAAQRCWTRRQQRAQTCARRRRGEGRHSADATRVFAQPVRTLLPANLVNCGARPKLLWRPRPPCHRLPPVARSRLPTRSDVGDGIDEQHAHLALRLGGGGGRADGGRLPAAAGRRKRIAAAPPLRLAAMSNTGRGWPERGAASGEIWR